MSSIWINGDEFALYSLPESGELWLVAGDEWEGMALAVVKSAWGDGEHCFVADEHGAEHVVRLTQLVRQVGSRVHND